MLQNAYNYFIGLFDPLRNTFVWPGIVEVGKFLGTHLISGMIPAFFIAGAISIFLDKQRITKLMGANANPLISYPVAALSGGILTVCSCGVIPIFTGILQQGAGIGPAFTFLMASPAVNLIALTYTYSLLGTKYMFWRAGLVFFSSIFIGLGMRALCTQPEEHSQPATAVIIVEEDDDNERSDTQLLIFFMLLILIMVTSTGVLDPVIARLASPFGYENLLVPRLITILIEISITAFFTRKWFHKYEIILWLKKSQSLFYMIFPKVLGGIFLCGIIAVALPLTRFISYFDANNVQGNLLASALGSMMYFGTIVGVTIVSTLKGFGMNDGPAMTLLLSAPAVSLPSILALVPIVGTRKAVVFLTLVIIFSALSGLIFGMTF
ncbi:MAG: permease [Candidatus Rifleibacteriota bacterium]